MDGIDLSGVVKGKSEGSITIDDTTYSLNDDTCSEKLDKIINFFKINDKVVYSVKNDKLIYIAKSDDKKIFNTMPLNTNSGKGKQARVETKTGGGGITPRYTVPEIDKRTVRMNALRHASVEVSALLSTVKEYSLSKIKDDTLFLAKKYEKYILDGEVE